MGTYLCTDCTTYIANCSRGIRDMWHSYYALVVVVKLICGGFGIALLTP
nr:MULTISPECIES: DUF3265 domain-containing protein [Vibrio]